jgi:multiple sugar transport system ATP-binding protein
MASLTLDHVSKRYASARRGGVEPLAVNDVSLAIRDGEIIGLLGSSGCGKTSTLRMIAGFESVTEGQIRIGERVVNDLRAADRQVAMAFEGYALYPPLTVGQNIAFSLLRQKVAKDEARQRVQRIAELLEITDLLELYPPLLSGGQQQRVSLARALVREADLYLLDEPMSQLEPQLRAKLRARIKEHLIERRMTAVFVTHDQTEAVALADRIAVMSEGVLQQFGSPDDLKERPANLFVAGFIGEPPMNLFRAELHGADGAPRLAVQDEAGAALFELALPAAARWAGFATGQALRLGLRPHRIRVGADGGEAREGGLASLTRGVAATVVSNHWLGDQSHIGLMLGEQFVTVVADRSLDVAPDSRIGLQVSLEALHVFDAASGRALFHGPDARDAARAGHERPQARPEVRAA